MYIKKSCEKNVLLFLLSLAFIFISCKNEPKKEQTDDEPIAESQSEPFFKLSLAEWSLHRTFNDHGVSPFDFAKIADSLGINTLEYVSQLYNNQINEVGFDSVVNRLLYESQKYNMKNNLIMIDNEGDLASPDEKVRDAAVENHKRWVDAAQKLGCQAIRVNTFGTNDPELWVPSVVDGLRKLSTYAATKNINVICENHGWFSSNTPFLMKAISEVNMENCGTLPDFGNWCIKRKDGAQWGDCEEVYPDKYQGIKMMLNKAKAVSAKAYDFDENGNETTLDFPRIIQLVKNSGYTSYIGIEYEGDRLSEIDGIMAIKNLLLKSAEAVK